jgi:putative transposase
MTRRKPEQIVQLLHKADEELAKGKAIEDICRDQQISPATHYRWKQKYGGLNVQDAKRLKALEIENAKLKRLLAETMLANDTLQEFLSHLPWRAVPGKKA